MVIANHFVLLSGSRRRLPGSGAILLLIHPVSANCLSWSDRNREFPRLPGFTATIAIPEYFLKSRISFFEKVLKRRSGAKDALSGLTRVHSERVDLGSEQGLSDFETGE